jgi:ABC-type transport system involved in multi-copper enzyme maturation permease subunit
MTQFLAILRDSFREAMDGFVIYAMLALSALTILIVGSMSFTAVPAQDAFDHIAMRFNTIIPERGRSRTISFNQNNVFKATDVTPAGSGYKFRLTVTGKANAEVNEKSQDGKETSPDLTKGDTFRAAVAQWSNKSGETMSIDMTGKRDGKAGGKNLEFSMPTQATAEEQRAITTQQMEEFLTSQFEQQAGISATVQRVTTGVAEPMYAFDVTTVSGSGVRGWPHKVEIFFGSVTLFEKATLGMVLWGIEDKVINGMGAAVALLISIIMTAFFVPNMIRKGSVDLLISKPIGRTPLLVYKYIGGLTFIFVLSAVTIGGVWLALAVRSGFWDPTFLVLIPVLTFTFAILYSVSVLMGVLTRSPIVAMLATIGTMFFFWLVGVGKIWAEETRKEDMAKGVSSHWLVTAIETFNTVLPRYKDLDTITSKLIADGTLTPAEMRIVGLASLDYPSWAATFGVSLAFIAVMLAVACWRFKARDS